jgi:cytochrome c oxidase cbb3-type subunit 4
MDFTSFFGSLSVVLSLATFLGIVAWAYSKGRKKAFDEAANAPFALPDDVTGTMPGSRSGDHTS